jgi:peptidyl-tRNA hydrolase, PTH1 family
MSAHIDWIIAGLGNPGVKYEQTRHNIGFMVCEALSKKYNTAFIKGKGDWLQSIIKIKGKSIFLMLPTTYMNNSGEAILKVAKEYSVPPASIMIVVDEYNFPLGRVHLKQGGSDGGHNGTASVIKELNSSAFWRLRCGIAKNFGPGELVEYVLSNFNPNEVELCNEMIQRSVSAIEQVMHAGTSRAISTINSGEPLS